MLHGSSVLIVDASAENREVLRTALAGRGARVLEASRADEGLSLARKHRPDLIVLDAEIDADSPDAAADQFGGESPAHGAPLLLLGNARRSQSRFPGGQFVAKPYHYTPLIRKIEELITQQSNRERSLDRAVLIRHPGPGPGRPV